MHGRAVLSGGRMIETVDIEDHIGLDDYASIAHLAAAVHDLRAEAGVALPHLGGRTVWMVNSTAQGGGVAEMLPKIVALLRELGIRAEWLVISTGREEFFGLTKRIHNMVHGVGSGVFSAADRALYDAVSRELADELATRVGGGDLLVVHDPQPLGAGAVLKRRTGVRALWRCHIGLDETTPATSAAWNLLRPYAEVFDHAVFSAPEYIPSFLAGSASVIYPALDPLSHKNRELSPHKLVGVLCNAGLMESREPVLTPTWSRVAMRLQPDGRFLPLDGDGEAGLLFRPTVTQISRWDRLKGWRPLLEGFLQLKRRAQARGNGGTLRDRRLEILRLVLAGPDPAAIQDDPEGREVLDELVSVYRGLAPAEQRDVALFTLPMESLKENALMVNALQRCSTVVAQNSLREGFGLTATEAMWKRLPVLGTVACGLRQQVRDGVDGRLARTPGDAAEIAELLDGMLADPAARDAWGRNAQRHVHERFLIFTQLGEWLRQLVGLSGRPRSGAEPATTPS